MTDGNVPKKPELTVIRGGRTDRMQFAQLPLADKISRIRSLPAKKRMEPIISDPEGERLAQALLPQELYLTFTEIGAEDAMDLLNFASPEQREFFLDVELWEKGLFSQKKALMWLGYLLEMGEQKVAKQLHHLDPELLILLLLQEIAVGGGVGELMPDDERMADWDHSFDNLYFISFRNPKNARLIGTFLDIVFRRDQQLYRTLLEGVKNEVESEMAEEAYLFRAGRMADLGFPDREEAIFIYARIDPGSFVPAQEKKQLRHGGIECMPVPLKEDTMLARALRRQGSEELLLELNYLINNALVAEETSLADSEAMQTVMQRVSGYLTIALEFLCGDDVEKAAAILESEPLKRLFQLGHAIVQGLRKKAERLNLGGYATDRAFSGLKT